MKIIVGCNKKNFIKKIKIVSFKFSYMLYKYYFLKYYQIISFINDRRQEVTYNDIILAVIPSYKENKILKIIRRNDNY